MARMTLAAGIAADETDESTAATWAIFGRRRAPQFKSLFLIFGRKGNCGYRTELVLICGGGCLPLCQPDISQACELSTQLSLLLLIAACNIDLHCVESSADAADHLGQELSEKRSVRLA